MKTSYKNFIDQYKLLFYLSWIILYFIFPSWRTPNLFIQFNREIVAFHFSPKIFLLLYFFAAAYFLNYSFKTITVDSPLISYPHNLCKRVRNNLCLVLVCCTAVVLHIHTFQLLKGSVAKGSLYIYLFINDYWLRLFDFSIQYPVWLFIFLLIIMLKQKKLVNFISSRLHSGYLECKSSNLIKFSVMFFLVGFLFAYSRLLPYYSSIDHVYIVSRYPPVSTLLTLGLYFLFGTGTAYLPQLIVQLTSYVLGSLLLFKTVNLFYEKKTALLGASIYLFSPLVFAYAFSSQLASGTVFFIILVSYFSLRFIRDENPRDLILAVYFISIGSLYKRPLILMFLVFGLYLVISKIKNKDKKLVDYLKILSISVITFVPWMFIGSRMPPSITLSNYTSTDSLFSYFLMIPSQISWPVFLLFLLSIIVVLFSRKNHLSLFFGLVFIIYYLLFSGYMTGVHRFSMAFYPTIAVFIALAVHIVLQKVIWKYAFKLIYFVLIVYLAILCIIPRSSSQLITFKYTDFENQYFPNDKAIEWILNQTEEDERVMVFPHFIFLPLINHKGIKPGKITFMPPSVLRAMWPWDDINEVRQYLEEQYKKMQISYIMFPVTKALVTVPNSDVPLKIITDFLKEDKTDDFITAAKFNIDDNYIYIYKLRDNS